MKWFIDTLRSSVGKKSLMSLTGFTLCGFLTGHLAGNLTLYGGQEMLNDYSEHLHSIEPFLGLFEWSLLGGGPRN